MCLLQPHENLAPAVAAHTWEAREEVEKAHLLSSSAKYAKASVNCSFCSTTHASPSQHLASAACTARSGGASWRHKIMPDAAPSAGGDAAEAGVPVAEVLAWPLGTQLSSRNRLLALADSS